MSDFKLKMILSGLLAVVVSLTFIIIAFFAPLDKEEKKKGVVKKKMNRLEVISKQLREK
jgi:hypothetical protein